MFDSLLGAIAKFMALFTGARAMEHSALDAAGKEFLKRAQAAIGTYEYGWQPLADSTVARKASGDTPLLETGAMRDSGFYRVEGRTVIVGFSDPKIRFHEFGTRHVPPRPVIGGTIDHHGQEIAHLMAVHFGEVMAETLVAGSVASAIGRVSRRHR